MLLISNIAIEYVDKRETTGNKRIYNAGALVLYHLFYNELCGGVVTIFALFNVVFNSRNT